mmetsp:Transcript_81580/g.227203  ORF Transcript_81580/g.227203 Transcript_81580/m.227203 type:complete len:212 (+) Transcript_81580:182-817(+)
MPVASSRRLWTRVLCSVGFPPTTRRIRLRLRGPRREARSRKMSHIKHRSCQRPPRRRLGRHPRRSRPSSRKSRRRCKRIARSSGISPSCPCRCAFASWTPRWSAQFRWPPRSRRRQRRARKARRKMPNRRLWPPLKSRASCPSKLSCRWRHWSFLAGAAVLRSSSRTSSRRPRQPVARGLPASASECVAAPWCSPRTWQRTSTPCSSQWRA